MQGRLKLKMEYRYRLFFFEKLPLTFMKQNSSSERLVFEIDGETVFMPKGQSVTVKRPGGSAATNQFTLAHSRFFSGRLVNESIKK